MDVINGLGNLYSYQAALAKVSGFEQNDFTAKKASFSNYLSQALNGINNNISAMDQATTGIVTGTNNDLGSAMVKMTEAQLSIQTAVQVRNKVLDAYNDIKNMQF